MLAIINAELVMKDHLIPEAVLFVEDGKIAGFGEMRSTPVPEGCEIIDAKGLYVGPGLVDIHTHTGGEHRHHAAVLHQQSAHEVAHGAAEGVRGGDEGLSLDHVGGIHLSGGIVDLDGGEEAVRGGLQELEQIDVGNCRRKAEQH